MATPHPQQRPQPPAPPVEPLPGEAAVDLAARISHQPAAPGVASAAGPSLAVAPAPSAPRAPAPADAAAVPPGATAAGAAIDAFTRNIQSQLQAAMRDAVQLSPAEQRLLDEVVQDVALLTATSIAMGTEDP